MMIVNNFARFSAIAMLCGLTGPVVADDAHHSEAAAKVVENFHAALKQGNAKAALAQLSDDAIIFESGHMETRSEYANHHLEADIMFAKGVQRSVKGTTQQCVDSLCVIMQQSETVGKLKGKDVRSAGVETTVLRREGDIWKIHHVHWSSHK